MNTKEAKQAVKTAGKSWVDFLGFMYGQTVGVDDNGHTIWYEGDVRRFCEGRPVID